MDVAGTVEAPYWRCPLCRARQDGRITAGARSRDWAHKAPRRPRRGAPREQVRLY
jgi:hypothetical protein